MPDTRLDPVDSKKKVLGVPVSEGSPSSRWADAQISICSRGPKPGAGGQEGPEADGTVPVLSFR